MTSVLRVLLAVRAKGIVNAVARRAIARKPVAAWGLQQGMHITGTATAYDFLRSTTRFNTRRISAIWSPPMSCCSPAPMTTTCR